MLSLCDFLITLFLKDDVNVPTESNKHKNYKKLQGVFFVGILKAKRWRKEQDPDPLFCGMDPEDPDP